MKRRFIAVTLAGISCLLLSTHANAMTDKEATTLAWAAYKGNQADFAQLEQAAKSGSLPAQFGMGEIYLWENNYPLSAQWFQGAAEKGDPGAENALGYAYQNGQGVSQDYGMANAWYYKAAQQGDAVAECNLGHMYFSGWGVAKSYATAVYWSKKSAAQGYGLADAGLGDIYLYGGYGVQNNPGIALYSFIGPA
jgi:TPR repeat protein